MLIYKILTADQWADLQTMGETQGAPIDISDGFVHFSTAAQVAETAEKHFAGQENLQLLALEADDLGHVLKWDISRGGDLFPHLYANLRLRDVLWCKPLPFKNNRHQFPEDVT